MTSDIVDDRLIGALHVQGLTRAGLEHDPHLARRAIQAGTLQALLDGGYRGDTTIGELLGHGDLGVGTVEGLDGELVILDGQAWVARASGRVEPVDDAVTTPFAVLCAFRAERIERIEAPLDLAAITSRVGELADPSHPITAVRVEGEFTDLTLRSVPGQQPPYPPLAEAVAHQRTWRVDHAEGSLVGFWFPAELAGLEVPGAHLHFLSHDRRVGGHALAGQIRSGRLATQSCVDLHVELPPGVSLGHPGEADRGEIADLEGGAR